MTETKTKTYFPLILILAYILGITALVGYGMHDFMGAFFIVFSFFKLLDLPGFVVAFRKYDILAKQIKFYGYLYPFIELGLGIGFILKWQLSFLNSVTVIVMLISSFGVLLSLLNKQKIQCACLGTVFNLPMSTVALVENFLMLGMALYSFV